MDAKLFKWSVSLWKSGCVLVNVPILSSGGTNTQILYFSKMAAPQSYYTLIIENVSSVVSR